MNKFIIAEGFDNSGKTTLLGRLSRYFEIPVVHSPGPQVDMRQSLEEIMEQAKQKDMLRDRICLISEEVYGKILRGKSEFDSDLNIWWLKLLKLNPVIIYCRPNTESIFKSIADREQMDGIVTRRKDLLKRYDEVISYLSQEYKELNLLTYDYNLDPQATQIIEDIRRILK